MHLWRIHILLPLNRMLYKYVSFFILCLNDVSSDGSEVLKFPTFFVLLLISSFMVISNCLIYWGAPMWVHYVFTIFISSYWSYGISFFVLFYSLFLFNLFYLMWVLLLQLSFDFSLHGLPSFILLYINFDFYLS